MRQFPTVTWRGERRAWALTLGASAALHALGLALLVRIEPSPPRAGATGWVFTVLAEEAGGGGGPAPIQLALRSLGSEADPDLPAPPASLEIEEPDIPTVDLVLEAPVSPEPLPVAPPAPAPPPGGVRQEGAPAVGGGTGGGAGAGSGPGTGAGVGQGSGGGGAGDGIRPPSPLTILVPPTATASVRGKAARVLLQVDSAGRVRSADVVVSSGDRSYDEQLRRIALGWRFRPARDAANRPVPYPFEVSVTF